MKDSLVVYIEKEVFAIIDSKRFYSSLRKCKLVGCSYLLLLACLAPLAPPLTLTIVLVCVCIDNCFIKFLLGICAQIVVISIIVILSHYFTLETVALLNDIFLCFVFSSLTTNSSSATSGCICGNVLNINIVDIPCGMLRFLGANMMVIFMYIYTCVNVVHC